MKKIKILYWVITGLFAVGILLSAISQILNVPEEKIIMRNLGYPGYIIPFLGIAKLMGIIAIVTPGFSRLKEWAFAGLFFDLIGAIYSHLVQDGWQLQISFMLLPVGFLLFSHILYHKKMQAKSQSKII
jgi:hypothetical protein